MALAFAASGAAALVYQVAWQRILALHSGVGIYSVAMIVAAFMAGLGLGSVAGAAVSARVPAGRSLLLFALVELGIGAWGALSTPVYYDLLYERAAGLYEVPWRAGLLHFAALLPPTALMGMSLPLLVRALVRDVEGAAHTVGWLYGINVLGAAAGALATPWLLVPAVGLRGATLVAAGGNLLAGSLALALRRALPPEGSAPVAEAVSRSPGPARSLARWAGLYATSGFVALSLEVLWFRVVDVAVKSTAFTFGTVLALYLLGLGAGSLPSGRRLRDPLATFLGLQCAIVGYAATALLLLATLPATLPGLAWLTAFWATEQTVVLGRDWAPGAAAGLYLALPLALFGLPTVWMGRSFVALQRAVQDDVASSGRKVGLLQAANIAGCVGGSLLVGLVGLSRLGTTGTLRVLLGIGIGFAGLGLVQGGNRRRFIAAALALAALMAALPGQERLWRRLHGQDAGPIFVAEDATGVVALPRRGEEWAVAIDGKTHSALPFGGIHTFLGSLPVLMHPRPERVAVIGLGSGDTAWAAGCRPATRSVDVYEICAGVEPVLRRVAAADPRLREARGLFADGRYRWHVADGRKAMERGGEPYDVIEADALWPESAYSGNLYSVEFFARCARRLAPGGLMCSWSPTPRIEHSFRAAFPHVIRFVDVLVGSARPLPADLAALRLRLADPETARYLGGERIPELQARVASATAAPQTPPRPDLNHDLFPRDEYLVGRR